MRNSFFLSSIALVIMLGMFATFSQPQAQAAPLIPDTGSSIDAPQTGSIIPSARPGVPVRVRVPSIGLDAPIARMGLNPKGEVDVPDGTTQLVGWWGDGAVPGEMGSAIMDAHVYAAFAKLRYALPGTDIYVDTDSGRTLHFRVTDSRVYTLAEFPLQYFYNRADARRLNLITCAGTYDKRIGTYDHRLVAYAELIEG